MSGTFKDLKCWQKAFELALAIYRGTRSFPKEETYGLTSQLRRAAVSVASNIAEGKGRTSDKELLQFLGTAKGSLFELDTQLQLAERLCYLSKERAAEITSLVNETGRLLNGFMKSFGSGPKAPASAPERISVVSV